MSEATQIRIGIDTGGTFTDVVAFDKATGTMVTTKTPSTPSNPARGFLAGISKVLDIMGLTGEAIETVSHGTTVGTIGGGLAEYQAACQGRDWLDHPRPMLVSYDMRSGEAGRSGMICGGTIEVLFEEVSTQV